MALAFAVMAAAELALLCAPGLPRQIGVLAIVAARLGAFKFTSWRPDQVQSGAVG